MNDSLFAMLIIANAVAAPLAAIALALSFVL